MYPETTALRKETGQGYHSSENILILYPRTKSIQTHSREDCRQTSVGLFIDRFHCHAINTAPKKYWKPPSGRSQENEML